MPFMPERGGVWRAGRVIAPVRKSKSILPLRGLTPPAQAATLQGEARMPSVRFLAIFIIIAGVWFVPFVHAGFSNSLMDISPDGRHLVVANPDNGTVTVVDTVARKSLREIPVGEKPEGVTWIGPGPLAAATVYHEDAVVFFNTESGQIVKKLPVPDEPYGIVSNK